MGQAQRTTILLLDWGDRKQAGVNTGKRAALEDTKRVLDTARAFSVDCFLAHQGQLCERVRVVSAKTGEAEERLISAERLLTWAEVHTVATGDHPEPLPGWNFSERFSGLPWEYRRSLIQAAIGKARGDLTHCTRWQQSGKRKGKPGLPGSTDHPTLVAGTIRLETGEALPVQDRFARLKVCRAGQWEWMNDPVKPSRYFASRLADPEWESKAPPLVVRPGQGALHVPQVKPVQAKKVVESKRDPEVVTVGGDLNVKNLAVVTVRREERLLETVLSFRSRT